MNIEQTLTFLFFTLAIIKTAGELYLNTRNEKYVLKNMKAVPEAFTDKITLAEHEKAALYTIAKSKLSKVSMLLSFISLMIFLPLGLLEKLDSIVRYNFETEIVRGLALFGLFFLINLIIELPLKIYSTFVLEENFGFNKTTPKVFIIDNIKQIILGVVLATPFLYGILYILNKLGDLWWLYAWAFMMFFQFAILLIYPNFIAPLFNKFTKLEDDTLMTKIEELLKKIGFSHSGIFVMDASKRSSHGNAYFTGFGKTKRIVFFDNLLKSLDPEEVEAVLAHELGHFKHKHIFQMLIISTISALVAFFILGLCYKSQAFFEGHFIAQSSSYMALLLFSLVSPLYTFFTTPIFSIFSRKNEYEADSFAAKYSNSKKLISALVNLYKDNASTLTPDPLYSKVYYSHPPALERIRFLETL